MTHYDDSVNNYCATLGHVYCDTLVVRCTHDEAVYVTVRTWIDTDDGDTQVLFEHSAKCGPFDTPEEIDAVVLQLQKRGTTQLLRWSVPTR